MKTVAKIIESFGGLDWLADNYIRLENPPYMRLVIERIGEGPRGFPAISVAHYYEQNGDAAAKGHHCWCFLVDRTSIRRPRRR